MENVGSICWDIILIMITACGAAALFALFLSIIKIIISTFKK